MSPNVNSVPTRKVSNLKQNRRLITLLEYSLIIDAKTIDLHEIGDHLDS